MRNLDAEKDLSSKENISIHIAILVSVSFVISVIITIWFFVLKCKKCNVINIIMFLIFNFSMAAFSIFPLMSSYDNYLNIMEKIEVYDAKELEPIRKKIRTYYKIIHYVYYALSDTIIPFFTTLYLKRYLAKKDDNEQYKCFSFSILIGFLFFIVTIVVFAIGAIVIVCVLPEPKLEELKENTEGWDGLMFNLRNIASLAEYELNLLLSGFLLYFKGGFYIRWFFYYCIKKSGTGDLYIMEYWKIGKLMEKKESKDDDKLSDFDVAQKELQEERNDYLADKLINYYKNSEKCCNKYYIPKFIYEIPLGLVLLLLGIVIMMNDINNTFGKFTSIDYGEIKTLYEKSQDKEKMKEDILGDFFAFFFLFILFFSGITYSIITRNYYKEYFPYIGSEHNGYGFLILLKFMIRIQPPIYFIVFFPIIKEGYNPIIANYFKLFKFTIDKSYWPLVKGILMCVILVFGIGFGFAKGGIFKVFREGHLNDYVIKGSKEVNGDQKYFSSLGTIELHQSEDDSKEDDSREDDDSDNNVENN